MAAAVIDIKISAEKGIADIDSKKSAEKDWTSLLEPDVNTTTAVSDKGEAHKVKHYIPWIKRHWKKIVIENDVIKQSESCGMLSNGKYGRKDREFFDVLMLFADAKNGVKYNIEVSSPLGVDGTYWACRDRESGYIKDKLTPLSDMLRTAAVTKAENFDEMVCAKSTENKLWMRAVVIKEIDNQLVKLRYVDIGHSEDFQKDQIYKVPESFSVIPYLAFHCALFEESMKITYEHRWRFSDLCKNKLVDFTCKKVIKRENNSLFIGKLETDVDNTKIDVSEEVKNFINDT